MLIQFITPSQEKIEDNDWRSSFEVKIDGEKFLSVYDDDPEDSNLSRSFNDVYKIPELLEKVVQAVRDGEKIIFENIEE
jgi:hypothetical protein